MTIAPYISVLALLMIGLSFQVIRIRRRDLISIGDGGNKILERHMRAFGNFSEYTPMILCMLIACELSDVSVWKLHLLGLLAVLGRILHATSFQNFVKNMKSHLLLRQPGMILTFSSLLLGALFLIIG